MQLELDRGTYSKKATWSELDTNLSSLIPGLSSTAPRSTTQLFRRTFFTTSRQDATIKEGCAQQGEQKVTIHEHVFHHEGGSDKCGRLEAAGLRTPLTKSGVPVKPPREQKQCKICKAQLVASAPVGSVLILGIGTDD